MLLQMLAGWWRTSAWLTGACLVAALACGRTSQGDGPEQVTAGAQNGSASGSASSDDGSDGGSVTPGGAVTVAGQASEGGAGGAPEAAPGRLLFDGPNTHLHVISDREGNALVQWEDGKALRFARWIAARQAWLYPNPLTLSAGFIVDTYGSGHPILIGDELDSSTQQSVTTVRRFDLQTNQWGPPQRTGIKGAFTVNLSTAMDGVGNVYAFWLADDRSGEVWTWWPVENAGWQPAQRIDRLTRIVAARQAGAWLWQENSGLGVRAFDLETGGWGDETELLPLGWGSGIHLLSVGPSGEAVLATLRHDPSEFAMLVHRYDPKLQAWQPVETAWQTPTDPQPNFSYGLQFPVTDINYHDIVAASVPVADKFELLLNRRDPSTGAWSSLHTFDGLRIPNQVKIFNDDSGNLYGAGPGGTLFHYSSASGVWTETPIDGGSLDIVVAQRGAFALGWNQQTELVAYRHDGAEGSWRGARGLPSGIRPEIGSVPFDIAPIGEDRAIAVWSTLRSTGTDGSVRAAFIE